MEFEDAGLLEGGAHAGGFLARGLSEFLFEDLHGVAGRFVEVW